MKEAEENKAWWKKQRTWAMVLGLASTIAGFVPAVQVAAAPMMAVAVLLGYKGMADAQTRIENTTAKTEKLTEDATNKFTGTFPPC